MSEEQVNDQVEEVDYESMSDEDFAKIPFPMDDPAPENEEEAVAPKEAEEEAEVEVGTSPEITQEEISVEEGVEAATTEEEEVNSGSNTADASESASDDAEEEEVNSTDEEYKRSLKFGDAEIVVNSEAELLRLAERGLGANKRIQELAPKLKTLASLEANGLLDQNKLNFLIALDKKDPEAIKKLITSSGIDPLDIDTGNTESDYTAPDQSVSDEELAVKDAFESITGTDTYEKTIDTISKFSDSDKAEIRKNPNVISQINEHHKNGYYAEIEGIVTKERALGNLNGLSNFAAYNHVWQVIQENSASTGGGQEAGHKSSSNGQSSGENLAGTGGNQEAGHNTNNDKGVGNAQKAAKKAAASTNKNRGSQTVDTINIDDLTDAEIKQLDIGDLTFID